MSECFGRMSNRNLFYFCGKPNVSKGNCFNHHFKVFFLVYDSVSEEPKMCIVIINESAKMWN